MSNSQILILALMVWIPFTLFYFRAEIRSLLSGGKTKATEMETLGIEDCLGASKQGAVNKPVQEPIAAPVPEPAVAEEEEAFVPLPLPTEPVNMEIVGAEEEDWQYEQLDMEQALEEEGKLAEVEQALRQPYRSEEDDRHIADKLHGLQDFEIFNTLRQDARLRVEEILHKFPPPPPAPLPEEEEEAPIAPDEELKENDMNDFLNI